MQSSMCIIKSNIKYEIDIKCCNKYNNKCIVTKIKCNGQLDPKDRKMMLKILRNKLPHV